MSTVQDALDYFKRTNENSAALADPHALLFAAQVAWMQAVTDAITTGTGVVKVSATEEGEVKVESVAPETLAAEPVVDAAPSSTEPATIAPTTPGV